MSPGALSTDFWFSAPMKILTSLLCLSALAFAQDPVDGKRLFDTKCGVCHSTDTPETRIGPSLKGAKTGMLSSGKYANHTSILKRIDEGGNGMPVFRELLTKEQKENIASYVLTL
jgi:mono/diheme cytochrome c family protein